MLTSLVKTSNMFTLALCLLFTNVDSIREVAVYPGNIWTVNYTLRVDSENAAEYLIRRHLFSGRSKHLRDVCLPRQRRRLKSKTEVTGK